MKKICILTTVHTLVDTRVFYKEALTLRDSGYDLIILGPSDQDDLQGIPIIKLKKYKSRVKRMLSLPSVLKKAIKLDADVYHLHDPELLPLGYYLQNIKHKTVIYDVHEYYGDAILSKNWIPKPLAKPISVFFNWLEKTISTKLWGIITVNEHMNAIFKKRNPNSIVVRNLPKQADFRPDFEKKQKQEKTIVYVGGLNKSRGLETIVKTMIEFSRLYPQCKLTCTIAGKIDRKGLPEELTTNLESEFKRGNIVYKQNIDYAKVPALLAGADIAWCPLYFNPNYEKAIPTKLIEYMASGLPVIASNFGYMKSIVSTYQSGLLVDEQSIEENVRAIKYLLDHEQEAKEMGRRGYFGFIRDLNWETEALPLLALYARVDDESVMEAERKIDW